jgi:hypothetical protein
MAILVIFHVHDQPLRRFATGFHRFKHHLGRICCSCTACSLVAVVRSLLLSPPTAKMSFSIRILLISIFFTFATLISAQSSSATAPSTPPPTSTRLPTGNGTSTTPPEVVPTGSSPPDVLLRVPELHVGRIELDVERLQADLNLNAKIAGLVTINAGVQVSIDKVNITIADVDVNLELIVRLGNLVAIVERVFDSLDLNPLLIGLVGNVTNLVGEVIGAVDGLLGSITQNGKTLNFLVDNLGNIVQEVTGGAGDALQQIVGNFKASRYLPLRSTETN